jgi:hypothetical protein
MHFDLNQWLLKIFDGNEFIVISIDSVSKLLEEKKN